MTEENIGELVLRKGGAVDKDGVVPVVIDLQNTSLNGKPFIGDIVKYNNPEDLAYGDWNYRRCGLCLMHDNVDGTPADNCLIADKSAHKFFSIPEDQVMPKIVKGIEVGNFCPYWTDFRAE